MRMAYNDVMSVVLITGPAASGKNTIAQQLVVRCESGADIDVDLVRWMYRKPHVAPWEGEKGVEQAIIGVEHACSLASSFFEHGLQVFITDVVLSETIDIYKQRLGTYELVIIQLMPRFNVCLERLHERGSAISDKEAGWVYVTQEKLEGVDYGLDNSDMSIDDSAEAVWNLLKDSDT